MSSCMCSRTRCHTMKCRPSHTTSCTFCFEADAPWGRNLMLTKMRNQPSGPTPNQPLNRRTWSHYRQTRQPLSWRMGATAIKRDFG